MSEAKAMSVGEDFPQQQARVRTIQQHAREIGPNDSDKWPNNGHFQRRSER